MTQDVAKNKNATPGRRPVHIILIGLGLVVLVAAGLWHWRIPLAELLIARQTGIDLEIERFDRDRLLASDLAFGDDGAVLVDWVEIGYTIGGLLRGEVRRVKLDGLRLRAAFDGARFTIPGLDIGLQPERDGPLEALLPLPLIPFEFENMDIGLATDSGPMVLTGSLSYQPVAQGQATIQGSFDLATGADRAIVGIDGNLTQDGKTDIEAAFAVAVSGTIFGDIVIGRADLSAGVAAAGVTAGLTLAADTKLGRLRLEADGRSSSLSAADFIAANFRGRIDQTGTGTQPRGLAFELRDLHRQDGALGGNFHLDADQGFLSVGQTRLDNFSAVIDGELLWSEAGAGLSFGPETRVTSARLSLAGPDPTTLTGAFELLPGSLQQLRYHLRDGISIDLEFGEMSLRAGGGRLSAAGLTLRMDRGGGLASLIGGQFRLPDTAIAFDGIGADFTWGADGRPEGVLEIDRIAEFGPATIVPLRGDFVVTPEGATEMAVSGHLVDASRLLRAELSAHHDLASGAGAAVARMTRINFGPDGAQPGRLFPVLQNLVKQVNGFLDFRGTARWDRDGLDSKGDLLLDLAHVTTGELRLDNLVAALHFDSLLPLTTPPGQEVLVGRLDIGVPVTQGRMEVQLRADGKIEAVVTALSMFGGAVVTDPFVIDPATGDLAALLRADGLVLDELLGSAELGTLTSTGTLTGEIPISVMGGELSISGGRLQAVPGGGVIVYAPNQSGDAVGAANDSVALVLEALKNFHYDDVVMTIDEGEAETLDLRLALSGRNPALYDGKPFELNIAISGPLREVLNQGLDTITMPPDMLDRIGVFGSPAQ